jgi:hypothetical protein
VVATLTDGSTLTGTVERVGADHFDLADRPPDVGDATTVPFGALALVRRRP